MARIGTVRVRNSVYLARSPLRSAAVGLQLLAALAFGLAACANGSTSSETGSDDTAIGDAAGDTLSDATTDTTDLDVATSPCPDPCVDDNPCTLDTCNAETGMCEHTVMADGTGCGCNHEGTCQNGVCDNATLVCTSNSDCSDGLQCTRDLCYGGCQCVHEPIPQCFQRGGGPPSP